MIKEVILDEFINKESKDVPKIIAQARSVNEKSLDSLYSLVLREISGETLNTLEQVNYLDAFKIALTTFRSTSRQLRVEMDLLTLENRLNAQKDALKEQGLEPREESREEITPERETEKPYDLQRRITDGIFLSNRYALYFAGKVGLSLLDCEASDNIKKFTFLSDDGNQDRDKLCTILAKSSVDALSIVTHEKKSRGEEMGDADLKETLRTVLTTWVNQFNWNTFKDTAEKYDLDKTKFVFGNYSVQGGEFKKRYDRIEVEDKIMKVKKEDVIGNKEYVNQVWQALLRLACYDFERRENPLSPPSVIFTYGAPGGGKTMTAHALIRSFAEEICVKYKIPFWGFTHSITDFGSKYQNETPLQLAMIRDKIKNFPGLVTMYAADADTIFTSRKDNTSAEENKVSSVYFTLFDGSVIPKDGRVLFIMDANYVDGIDDATKSRVFDKIIELKRFQTAEEFSQYSRAYMTKGKDEIGVKEEEWSGIGQYLLNSPLSNREISNILRNLRGDFQITEDLVGKQNDEKVAFRQDHLRGVTKDTIIKCCDDFVQTRMEIERTSYAAKKANDLDRFREALKTSSDPTALEISRT